ncbi:MAG: N-formylglutamate deformylase [Alphaproteobacteria bacterium]|nr:N-formylglutamate deformylase [Alphaproteobacteria bacterium]
MQVKRLMKGTAPLLVSMPHTGTFLPPDIKSRMTDAALKLPDTDWHIDRLYWFAADMGASLLMPTHSRYVVDLNRPQDDADLYPGQVKTGLCPLKIFSGENIYKDGEEPDDVEKINRVAAYWLPYHEALETELARLKAEFGYAILYDAHSICSHVPLLFEGQLPDLNLGSARGASCAPGMAEAAFEAAQSGDYSAVLNGRFVGGHITRHYGRPDENIHALQMELTWTNYMAETFPYNYDEVKAEKLQKTLKNVLQSLLGWGEKTYSGGRGK